LFITFEGIDGAGKSTQIARVEAWLTSQGYIVSTTREPGGTAIGDSLRALLLNPANEQLAQRTEALLYAASRAQLIAEVIRPALAQGKVVICDRYVDASIAYQGEGLGLGVEAVRDVNRFATMDLRPDLTFLFDLPVDVSQSRVATSRGAQTPDRIERRDANYFDRVRACFLQLANEEPERFVIVDATRPPAEVEQEITRAVAKFLG
jgi:dTMP kinase